MIPVEEELKMVAPMLAMSRGLTYLRYMSKRIKYDPQMNQNPLNPVNEATLSVLHAEAYLGKLVDEYRKVGNTWGVPRGVKREVADRALLLYKHEKFIPQVFKEATKDGKIVTWQMVVKSGMDIEHGTGPTELPIKKESHA